MRLSRPARQNPNNGFDGTPPPGGHRGLDYGWGSGDGIYAAAPGVVESVYGDGGWNGGWGDRISIRHTPRAVTTYNHWAVGSCQVSPGQSVSDQQALATMGETGNTQGEHLHFELYIDGDRVDPTPYFTEDLPGSDGSGVGGVSAPSGWTVGETDFTGSYGLNELNGARWYVIEPSTDDGKTIWAIANQYGVDLASVASLTAKVAGSKWSGQLLQGGSSWWDGSDTYYAGVCIALIDVAAILVAVEAVALSAQRAAVAASQIVSPQPAVDGSGATNKPGAVDPALAAPVVPQPVVVKPRASAPRARKAAPTVEEIAEAASAIRAASKAWEADPASPPISDKVALPLWLIIGGISVSVTPILLLPTLDWGNYGPDVAQQAAALIIAWAGSIASLLGLSRFARTK